MSKGFQKVDKKEIFLEGVKSAVFMGDVGCTMFNEDSKKIVGNILEIDTDLFVVLGDIAFLGKEEEIREVVNYCDERVKVPIFSIKGNHDIPGYGSVLGSSTYALVLEEFVLMLLDNASMLFEQESLDFLEEMLNKHTDKRFLICYHIPPPTDMDRRVMDSDEWQRLKDISDKYSDRIECMFSAHIHGFQEYCLDGYRIFITGGGGAALYNLEKDTLKSHHAIKVSFDHKTVGIDVITV